MGICMNFKTCLFGMMLLFNSINGLEDQQMILGADAAKSWLKTVDNEEYKKSWADASKILQRTMSQREWEQYLRSARTKLGSLKERKMQQQWPAPNPKGLPAGDYMVILFTSSFTKKPTVQELVTLRLENPDEWRVLTYMIKSE